MQNESHRPNSAGRSLPLEEAVSLALAEAGPNLLKSPQNLWGYLGDVADRDAREVRALQRNCDESFVASLRPLVGSPSTDEVRAATERAASCLESNGVAEDLAQSIAEKVVQGLLRGQGLEGLLGQVDGATDARLVAGGDGRHPEEADGTVRHPSEVDEGGSGESKPKAWITGLVAALTLLLVVGFLALRPQISVDPGGPGKTVHVAASETDDSADDVHSTDDSVEDDTSSTDGPVEDTQSVAGGTPRGELSDYSWYELKAIADEIAAADSNAAGLDIAKEYGLTDAAGRLRGDEKPVTLEDGTQAHVRIVGFRHDKLASGGVAGITFEFADVPCRHAMNSTETNEGGWRDSDMRAWLNDEFYSLMPKDLRSRIEWAVKWTNNRGRVEENDLTAVTETEDRLWLLSVSEVKGKQPSSWTNTVIFDAEGTQYQLYADQGVTTEDYDFCMKDGANGLNGLWPYYLWWLRSANAGGSDVFRLVLEDGGSHDSLAVNALGVSPGFCL